MRALLGLMWLLHWLPLPVLGRLGKAVGSLLFHIMTPRREITLTNLRLCMPQLDDAQRQKLAKQHFQAYARSVLERGILWWAPLSRLKRLIHLEPHTPIAEMVAQYPVIFLCPHFVCLDVAGLGVSFETSGTSIYSPQKNALFDERLRKGRSRVRPIKLFMRSAGIKPIIRSLREKAPFFMLPDMDFGLKDAEFVPFFGIPAATLTAAPRLCAMTGARIVPVVATFLPGYRGWRVKLYAPWENYPGDDIVAATARMNAFIEERVLEAPAEYFWTHKRFKTRPQNEPGFYE